MVFHLAAPYIQDQLSLRSWKPTGTLTVRVKYRGPFRLPAVRVIGVLSGPAQPERLAGAKARAPGGGGAPGAERAAAAAEAAAVAAQSVFWGQSKEIASSAVSMWNTMVETHTARWSQSLQTLQRVSSRLFRSVSHDSVADADCGGGPASTSAPRPAPSSEEPSGGGAAAAAAVDGYQQHGEAAAAAAAAVGAAASAEQVAALAEQEALLQRQLEQLGQLQSSLAQFVTTASRKEVHLARMLADLSNIAYDVTQIVDDAALLESRHGLRLVACSHPEHFGAAALAGGYACPLPANGGAAAPLRHAAGGGGGAVPAAAVGAGDTEGDAEALFEMQLHPQWDQWLHWEADDEAIAPLREPLGAAAAAAPAATCWDEGSAGLHGGFEYSGGGGAQAPMSPRAPVVVSAMAVMEEGEAAAPVPASCCAALSPASGAAPPSRASRASSDGRGDSGGTPAAAQLCSSTAFDCALPVAPALDHQAAAQLFAAHHAPPPQQQQQQQEQEQQGAAHSAAPVLDAGVPEAPGLRQPQPQPQPQYPADWFVCDAPAGSAGGSGPTRYIVIQGSITVDHWRINLTFDPVSFVDGSTGVKVHRGVYDAALSMYDSLLPLVRDHLACAGPGAKVAFTGHSLGGSLATVITLLMIHRGDLPVDALASVHTFGAPAVFCDSSSQPHPCCGDAACSCGAAAAAPAAAEAAAPAPRVGALLPSLGLDAHKITNVVMHRDIVPRAFVCDYSLVADILKGWLPSFKEHTGLAACKPHKTLYHFVGDVEVLQPPLGSAFTLPDEGHFMLPAEPALYKLTEPSCPLPQRGAPKHAAQHAAQHAEQAQRAPPAGARALTLTDAVQAFFNTPHPLQTLSEVRAYGPGGSISRFHNPQNYTDALAMLL